MLTARRASVSGSVQSNSYQKCRLVKYIGQWTPRRKARPKASWGSHWSGGVDGELLCKAVQGIKAVAGIEAFLIPPVAVLHLVVVAGHIGTNELMSYARLGSGGLKRIWFQCKRPTPPIRGKWPKAKGGREMSHSDRGDREAHGEAGWGIPSTRTPSFDRIPPPPFHKGGFRADP